ncbi:MAG: ATP-dependent RNA helicase HrpA [Betaproteobacteria bacterium]|nr:ATP-dependent RNA helicase HrpA [Betaproteobacteria bacterium]
MARAAALPQPSFDGTLPIHAAQQAIMEAVRAHPVVIVSGETGSGKTTQIPKLCLALGRGVGGLIGCTQPRRIAARSVATRLAQELHTEIGAVVGYQVRFHDRVSDATFVKVMTDGILLSEIHHDRLLRRYDTLVIDEAHERSLNIDFLLGYLKRILPRRPDLKVIITSATMESDRLSRHFDGAPVLEVSGRTYPVDVRWRPVVAPDADDPDDRTARAALLNAVDEVMMESGSGDVLVFLPGERDIREAAEALRKHHPPHTEILPLFARQSFAEQERVFKPNGGRRIVLATNVAETSLTVPGIRYVVDTGLARINRYNLRSKVTQLQVEKISQASARQRAGRCGRVSSGICIRLYDEQDFNARPPYTTPEILRTSLASVILKMEALGLGQVDSFPFLDPPTPRAIDDGYQQLNELGAIDDDRKLTAVGRELARLPVDPRIGRMLLAARQHDCVNEVLIIAAALSVQDPRDRPLEHRQAADQKHARFQHEQSEFMSYLALWQFTEEALQHRKSGRKLWAQFREEFLSLTRLREWRDIHSQLHALASDMGLRPNTLPAPYEQIHRALLAGLLGQIGLRVPEDDNYQGPRGMRFWINPGSKLSKAKPKWLMAAELTETTRLYARCVARIEPEWVEPIAGHLLRRSYFDPSWDPKSAQANTHEKVTLYGLPIVARRRVRLGPIDPAEARRLFIRHALVLGEFETRAPFFIHNQRLIEEIRELEHKGRRQDVLVDEEALARFYDGLLPTSVWSGERFEKWRREAERDQPRLLFLEKAQLMRHEAGHITESLFPDTLTLDDAAHPLTYRFEPGHPLDGVTLTVPLVLLPQLDAQPLEWLVPGLIREKIATLLKKLPQRVRRELVPLPAFITAFLERYTPASGSLTACLSDFIRLRTGTELQASDWAPAPDHLLMNLSLLDDRGQEVASGRNLEALRNAWGQEARQALRAPQASGIERSGITRWDFGDLPSSVQVQSRGVSLPGFPALMDEGTQVSIRLMATDEEARQTSRHGLMRLMLLEWQPQLKAIGRSISGLTNLTLGYALLPSDAPQEAAAEALKQELIERALDELLPDDAGTLRTQAAYETLRDQVRPRLSPKIQEVATIAGQILEAYRELRSALERTAQPRLQAALGDIHAHLDALLRRGTLRETALTQLRHFPRYLKAALLRLQKLPQDPAGDAAKSATLKPFESAWSTRMKRYGPSPALESFRWMMEELRVSLFAQTLRTPMPVSAVRLQKQWEMLEREEAGGKKLKL